MHVDELCTSADSLCSKNYTFYLVPYLSELAFLSFSCPVAELA